MAEDSAVTEALEEFEHHSEAFADNAKAWTDDVRFALLEEQWPAEVKRQRDLDGRPCLTVSLLAPMIRQVVNDARQNKPGIEVHPVDSDADPDTAEIFNGLIRNIEQSSNAEVAYDTGLEHAVAGGFGYWRVNTAYANDDTFDQDLRIERISDPLSVTPDCNSTAADSSDWNVCFVSEKLTKEAFEKQYKGADPVNWKDGPYAGLQSPWYEEDMVRVAERWSRDEVPRTIVLLSDGTVMDEGEYKAQKALFDALEITVQGSREVRSHKVTQQIMSGAEVLETVKWAGRYIPIVPVYGSEVNFEGKRHLRSMIRGAKDSQRMRNYWTTTTTELVALQGKAPYIGKKGAFTTDQAKWATANNQNWPYIEYDGAEPPQRQPFAGIPAGAMQEKLSASDDIKAIVGIYDASLGNGASRESSGVAINARDRQADTGTFHFIDNLSRSIRHTGRILIDLIPAVYSVPRVVRIIGADGSPNMTPVNQPTMQPVMGPDGKPQVDPQTQQIQEVEKIYDLTVGKYDLTVKAGPSFASQREQFVEMATELIRAYPAAAPILAGPILKNYDMPDADQIAAKLEAAGQPQALPDEVKKGIQQLQDHAQQQGEQLQQQGAEMQALANENQQLKAKNDIEAAKVRIQGYEAETHRLIALKPDQVKPQSAA